MEQFKITIMNNDDLENKLENINAPKMPSMQHQWQLKLAILNAKRSASVGLWLMLIPILVLTGAFMKTVLHVSLPPWSWLVKYSPQWPLWIRVMVFVTVVIVFPVIAVLLNLLSIIWLQYDKTQQVLNISVRMRRINIIIIIVAGLLAFLFLGHLIALSKI